MRTKLKVLACLTGIAVPWMLMALPSAADETFTAVDAIPVPQLAGNPDHGLGSFDISFVDPFAGVYLLADRSNSAVDVVDISADVSVNRQLTGCGTAPCAAGDTRAFAGHGASNNSGPNGVITANDQKEVWAGDGHSVLSVIDIHTGVQIARIPTINPVTHAQGTQRADELCEDPRDHLVLIANDEGAAAPLSADLFVTFVSTKTKAIVDAISFQGGDTTHGAAGIVAAGGIEQCQWSPRTGKFYINLPAVGTATSPGATLQIDPITRQVEQTFEIPLALCSGPAGLAVGPDHQLLLGCANSGPGSVIIDERNGAILASGLNNGNDEVWYNFGDNHYQLAGGNHTGGPVLGIVDAATGTPDASATSALGSHSVAAEPFSNHVYVPINNVATAAGGAQSKICSTANPGISDSAGCIAVFASTGKDDKCAEKGAPVLAFDPDGPKFLKIEDCQTDRDHDHDH